MYNTALHTWKLEAFKFHKLMMHQYPRRFTNSCCIIPPRKQSKFPGNIITIKSINEDILLTSKLKMTNISSTLISNGDD